MPSLIIHNPKLSQEEIENLRLKRNLALSPAERIKMAFKLMAFSIRFRKGAFKEIQKDAILLKKS